MTNDILTEYSNITKCIKKIEDMPKEFALIVELSSPYKREYNNIIFQKNMETNKVSSISLIKKNDNVSSHKIDFFVLPTHDKQEIDRNIILV